MNSIKRYRQNSQLFIRQKDWSKPSGFYRKWNKAWILKKYGQDKAGTW